MKRWVALGVSALILLMAVLTFAGRKEITVGAGRGRSEKIETIEDFFDLAESASSYKRGNTALKGKTELVSTEQISGETGNSKAESEYKYTNLTFSEVSSIVKEQELDHLKQQVTFQRELTGYMTKEAVYYHSEGVMTFYAYSPISEDDNKSMCFSFDLDVYFGGEDCYIRFHEFHIVAEARIVNVPDEWRDIWISLGGEDGDSIRSAIQMVSDYNFSVLDNIGKLFEEYSNGKLKKDRKRYLLEGKEFDLERGSLEINLENEKKPRLSLLAPGVSDMIEFSNIENTVIKLPQNFTAYEPSDLEEYFSEEDF